MSSLMATSPLEVPIGGGILWFSETLPSLDWDWADGGELDQIEYSRLFGLWGFKYGTATAGKFKKPNLQNRFPKGSSPTSPVGTVSAGGSGLSGVTDTAPDHAHSIGSYSVTIGTQPVGAGGGATAVGTPGTYSVTGPTSTGNAGTHSHSVTISGSVDPPSLTVGYIIRIR